MQAFMNQTESAQYCGYSVDTFRRHMKTYPLPKYGPKANRYKCLDLDKWMEDPEQFRVATHRPSHTGRILSTAEQKKAIFGNYLGSILMQ